MSVTLDGIDIETITNIIRATRSQIGTKGLGNYSLAVSPNLKGMHHSYDVSGVWSNGDTDYDAKLEKIYAIQDSGIPVWLDASDWQKNAKIYGKIANFTSHLSEGAVNVDVFSFQIIATPGIGFTFVQDSGDGIGKLYNVGSGFTRALSDTYNPLLQLSDFTISATQMVYKFNIKNVGGSTGTIVIEIMVPDDLTSTASISAGAGWTEAVGVVGTSGFSSAPGTKRRATISKSFAAAATEEVTVTLDYTSIRASYIDGSIDENLI